MKIKQIIRTTAVSLMIVAAVTLPAFLVTIGVSTQAAYAADPQAQNPSTSTGEIDPLLLLTALMILFLPLFGVPLLLKFSGGLLGRIGAFVNNPNKGPFDKLRKSAEGYSQYRQNKAKGRIFNGKAGRFQNATFGRYARRQQDKDRIRAGVEREANRAATAYTADKLTNDAKFRDKAAGGSYMQGDKRGDKYQSAVARTRALGENELDKMIGEELAAGQVTIKNMQFSGKGLENLGVNGHANSISGQRLEGDFYQKAAQGMLISQGRTKSVEALVANAHNMSDGVRESLAYQIGTNYDKLKPKAHHLNDDDLKSKILSGTAITSTDLQNSAIKQLTQLPKATFATQEAEGLGHLELALQRGLGTADQRAYAPILARETLDDSNLVQFDTPTKSPIMRSIAGRGGPSPQAVAFNNPGPAGPQGPAPGPAGPAPAGPAGPAPAAPAGGGVAAPAPGVPAAAAPIPAVPGPVAPGPAAYVAGPAPVQGPAIVAPGTQPATPPPVFVTPSPAPRTPATATAFYTEKYLRDVGGGGINMIINNAGGPTALGDEDIEKIARATRGQNAPDEMKEIHTQMINETNRRNAQHQQVIGTARDEFEKQRADYAAQNPQVQVDAITGRQTPGTVQDPDEYEDRMNR